MSDAMGRALAYLSSHATNRYFIPNWGIYYKNLSNKTIKYFIWKGYAKNAVGDIVENEIGGNVSFSGKDTGPIRPGKTGGGCWDCIIYNWTAKKLVMTSVTIEYMDGTELKISEKEIKYIR